MKEVIFRTPVLIGVDFEVDTTRVQKVRYQKDSFLHENAVPQACQSLPNGIVIDLLTENINEYIEQFLGWLHVSSDAQLVDHMHQFIISTKPPKPIEGQSLRELDLTETPLFQSFDS